MDCVLEGVNGSRGGTGGCHSRDLVLCFGCDDALKMVSLKRGEIPRCPISRQRRKEVQYRRQVGGRCAAMDDKALHLAGDRGVARLGV